MWSSKGVMIKKNTYYLLTESEVITALEISDEGLDVLTKR